MRTALLLLLSWALSQPYATAQTRAAGPWRVVNRFVRYKLYNNEWSAAAQDWGEPDSSAHEKHTQADTATTVQMRREVYRVPWNVHPDSITLFLNCQNPLLAPAASRGQAIPLHFKTTGATVRLDPKQHLLLLVPTAPVVVLWAYRGPQLVFRHGFKAVPPPLPVIKCYISGSNANICKGPYKKPEPLQIVTLRAIADPDFAAILPDDARYRVARFRTALLRKGKPVEIAPSQPAQKTVQGPQGDLSDLASVARQGDQLQTDVLLVQRSNFRNIITSVVLKKRFLADGPLWQE